MPPFVIRGWARASLARVPAAGKEAGLPGRRPGRGADTDSAESAGTRRPGRRSPPESPHAPCTRRGGQEGAPWAAVMGRWGPSRWPSSGPPAKHGTLGGGRVTTARLDKKQPPVPLKRSRRRGPGPPVCARARETPERPARRRRQGQHCSPSSPVPMTIFVCRSGAGLGKVSAYVWPVEN